MLAGSASGRHCWLWVSAVGWFSVALRHDLSDVFAEHIERWQGSLIEGQSAVFRRCFKTTEFPTRTSCGGFSLRVVIKPMFHRILPELIPSFGQNCQGCHDMVNTCQYTHKTGHDPFDAAWWFQATLWAFRWSLWSLRSFPSFSSPWSMWISQARCSDRAQHLRAEWPWSLGAAPLRMLRSWDIFRLRPFQCLESQQSDLAVKLMTQMEFSYLW